MKHLKEKPIIYVDVDGVLIVPDPLSQEPNSISAKIVRDHSGVSVEQIPTAKDSWKNVRLKFAYEAKESLALIAASDASVVFLTTHPRWSVELILRRLGLIFQYDMAESSYPQSFLSHVHHKASVVEGERWAWLEDGLQPAAYDYLESKSLIDRYVEVDPFVGVTVALAEQAVQIALA